MGRVSQSALPFDRFPDGAYIEDGYLIVGDEAWTPIEIARELRARPDYSKKRAALYMREWRARNPERNREIARRHRLRRGLTTGRPVGRPIKEAA